MYNMTSLENHPLFTENSPRTRAAMTLRGVLSMFGVLMAASFRPSMASSSTRNCQIRGRFGSSCNMMKENVSGINWGLFIISRKVGVTR